MSDGSKLAPSSSPTIAKPALRPAPKKKARRIPAKVAAATEVLLSGQAKNLTEAAKLVGCSREYLSRTLSERPDAVQYMQQKAARVVGVASTVAAARMASLIHAESEHVSFRAAEHVLGVSGIKQTRDPQVAVNVSVRSGYLLDLRERADSPLPEIEEGAAGATIVDVKPATE